jgi:large repetitive protein
MFDCKLLPVKRMFMRKSLSAFVIPPLFLLFLIQASPVFSQQYQGHNWYFGNSPSGLRFSRSDNSVTRVTNQRIPFGTGGSSVASDPVNGNLLFYTDGSQIFDATHNLMPNGSALGANTSGNQPVAIAKAPGPGKRYYVFTNTANNTTGGTISFRIIDMNQLGNALFPSPALGAGVTATSTSIGALAGRSEAMITVPHANREDFWLITHANGTPDYTVTLVDATGIASATAFTGVGLIEVAANFSYHPASGRIAVSPQEARRDVEIITFDNATGALSFTQRALNTGVQSTIGQAIYDTEWSNSGDFLYISRHGETGIQGDVLQYDVVNQLNTVASVLPQPNTILRSYGLQMAPDSAIYHLYEATSGVFQLGTITDTDTVAAAVTYTPIAFTGNPDFDGLQFPSFAPRDSVLLNITFTTEGTCANSPVSFYPTVTPTADSLRWSFGDGNGATAWSPVHTYEAGGSFQVRVAAYLKGDSAVATQTLNITQFDVEIQLVQDTTACACELPINNGKTTVSGVACPSDTSDDMQVQAQVQGGSPTFQWYGPGGLLPGQTSATLRPDSAGYYYLVATMGACSAYAGVNVKEYDSLDQRANIWHFGQNAGIDFNGLPDDPPVATRGPLNTPEGTSVISDRNGQVIFSTDGQSIFIRDPADPTLFVDITPTPNPPGLGGQNTSSQSALIMPVPGDETLFYIFTTQEIHGSGTYELRYSLFDRKLNNGQGGLAEFNQLLFARSTERITGNDNWLIAHEFGNNSFRAYPISGQGIGNPTVSASGSDHSSAIAEQGQGYMELGAQNILAVAFSTPGTSNVVELFDFVDSTGVVTNFRTANLNSTSGQVYGLEISPGGNKLYATLRSPGTSQIVEFSIDSLGNPHFKQRVNQTGELGAMQIGPDGQIYVAINGSSTLGTFQANEDTTAVTALPNPLQPFALLAGTTSQLGLPNFTQIISNPISTPGFTVAGVCSGDSTQFSGTGKDAAIDKFYWTFGDGQSNIDGGPEIAHLYPALAPGEASRDYIVTLIIYNKCEPLPNGYATFTQTITIFAPPVDPTNAFNICQNALVLDANPPNAAGLTYIWSTGETTETITVNRQAIYDVTITDANTCTTDAQFLVADNRPQVELGPSVTICEETAIPPLDAQNPGTTYVWELNGAPTGGTAQTQSVDTSNPGIFEYKVEVTDPVSTCFARDSITYTINESPNWSAVPTDPTTCSSLDGQIAITIFAPANTLFTYSVTGPNTGVSNTDQPLGAIPPITGLDGGTYGVTISDQVSGCATINTVTLNDPGLTVAAVPNTTCDPIVLNVTLTINPGPLPPPYNYRVISVSSGTDAQGMTTVNTPTFPTTTPLASNNQLYVVEVTQGVGPNGCTASSPQVTVNEAPEVPLTLAPNTCVNPITIAAVGNANTYAWTGPNIVAGTSNAQTVQATPANGTHTYNLTATQAGFCQLDTAITVVVEGILTPDFALPEPCSDQAFLAAQPVGTYTYRWYRNTTALPGGGGQQISVTTADNGARYRVEVVNTVTGCIFTSTEKQIAIEGDLQITLASTPPCQEAPFTITTTSNLSPVTIQWFRNGVLIPNQSSPSLVQTENGLYSVTVARGQCQESQDFNIILSPNPPGLLPEKGIICPDPANLDPTTQQVVLDAGPGNLSYEWFKDGVSTGVTTQTYTATNIGFYEVAMTNSFMCANTDGITLVEECDPRISGPNAFRPGSAVNEGGEFVNREFRLFTFFIADTDFQIFIFNRWGEMIYQSPDRNFAWNGGYNNNLAQPLPPGTYSYIVRYKSTYRPAEGIQEKRGGVVLVK